jgi:IS605 OrfB family transposase
VHLTFKFRIKDATTGKHLARHAIACNQVWNFCVATQREAERRRMGGMNVRWPTAFDLINLTSGTSFELDINADTVSQICRRFVISRDQHRRCPKFRSSFGSKRSLGWVPIKGRDVQIDGDVIKYRKRRFHFWKSREIIGAFKTGEFVQDARGRWSVTFQCDVGDDLRALGQGAIGIDLGLKSLATVSDGTDIPAMRHFRRYEAELGKAQRARKKRLARHVAMRIANSRRDHLHKASARIALAHDLIFVGDVSSSKLSRTRFAKSVHDAGWASFKHMLSYKAIRHGGRMIEVNEALTSQTCSSCGQLPPERPKGIAGLGIREFTCTCGTVLDRDVNAARNILARGLASLAEGAAKRAEQPISKQGEGS